MVRSFRDLRVWQAGMELVEEIYRATEALPLHEQFGLSNQMRRAAVSVPSNIAEGHTRESTKEYLHHLSMAQASLAELQTQIEIAHRLHYFSSDQATALQQTTVSLAKQLYALRNSIRVHSSNP